MNVRKAVKVLEWVEKRKQQILADRPTQSQLAEQATAALGFKVSAGAIRDTLQEYGIETKRTSKAAGKMQALQERIQQLETLLTKLIAAPDLPSWLRDELKEAKLPEEASDALLRMEQRRPRVAV